MGFLFTMLALPVMGPPVLTHWLAGTIAEEAEREALDEGRVRNQLLELQQRYDAGEMGEDDYDREERVLLERLSAIRQLKARRS